MAGNRLYVGNLSYETGTDDLRQWFGEGGYEVTDVHVVTDAETGRSRGFAFVEIATESEAQRAVTAMNGRQVGGRQIKVNVAAERVRRDSERNPKPSQDFDRAGDSHGNNFRGYDRGGMSERSTPGVRSGRDARDSGRGARDSGRGARDSGRGREQGTSADTDRLGRGARDGDRKPRDF